MAKHKTITDQLRRAIADSGETLYRVAKDSGVEYATLHRFVHAEQDVKLATVDKLAAFLQLDLTKRKGGR